MKIGVKAAFGAVLLTGAIGAWAVPASGAPGLVFNPAPSIASSAAEPVFYRCGYHRCHRYHYVYRRPYRYYGGYARPYYYVPRFGIGVPGYGYGIY